MQSLLRIKKNWEFQNELYLMKLVETSADVSIESVKKAGLVTSFLLYVVYKILGVVLAVLAVMFKGPRLIRFVAPDVFENFEPTYQQPDSQFKNPLIR
jgi:hypothetical protein